MTTLKKKAQLAFGNKKKIFLLIGIYVRRINKK